MGVLHKASNKWGATPFDRTAGLVPVHAGARQSAWRSSALTVATLLPVRDVTELALLGESLLPLAGHSIRRLRRPSTACSIRGAMSGPWSEVSHPQQMPFLYGLRIFSGPEKLGVICNFYRRIHTRNTADRPTQCATH
jgi:hypothetical protein